MPIDIIQASGEKHEGAIYRARCVAFKRGANTLAFVFMFVCLFIIHALSAHAQACGANSQCASDLELLLDAETTSSIASVQKVRPNLSVKVDGEVLIRGVGSSAPLKAHALDDVNIDIKFDGLEVEKRASVTTMPKQRLFAPGASINFVANWNYPDWVSAGEVRIYKASSVSKGIAGITPHTILPLDSANNAYWNADLDGANGTSNYAYSLRLYNGDGRFDETKLQSLKFSGVVSRSDDANTRDTNSEANKNELAIANIPLHGGAVTVHGTHIPKGAHVIVMGEKIERGYDDDFVVQRIMPPGQHVVNVSIEAANQQSVGFEREVLIPHNDWFYVGLADLTIGKRFGKDSEHLVAADSGEYDPVYKRGRLAFYLKGKVKGKYLITAALDTTEENLDEIFSNLDEKDPRQFLRRLDPDDHYPIYGDDSELKEDAPTSGKFYVKIARGDSHVMWGNFKAKIDGTDLARFERSLHGAQAVLKSEATTSFGQPVASLEAFAAQPGTLAARDEFLGSGGSAYFLKRQDINQGSEQVSVEIRDITTGLIIDIVSLVEGTDYSFDYVQGVILLNKPLAAGVNSSSAVLPTGIYDAHQYLVVNYEYTPTIDEVDGYSFGGRAQAWLHDSLKLGTTAYKETNAGKENSLIGFDATLRLGEKSYVKVEHARSRGTGNAYNTSSNSGLLFTNNSAGSDSKTATANSARIHLDMGELTDTMIEGSIGAGYEERAAGFSAPGRNTLISQKIYDAHAKLELSDGVSLTAKAKKIEEASGNGKANYNVEIDNRVNQSFSIKTGVDFSNKKYGTITSDTDDYGKRTDLGARLTWHGQNGEDDKDKIYVFGQKTISKDKTRNANNRIGFGFEKQISSELSSSAQVSWGDTGFGLLAALGYEPNNTDKYYVGYKLEPLSGEINDLDNYDPFGRDIGSLIFGSRRKLDDRWSVYTEHDFDFIGKKQGIVQTYGVDYAPSDEWKYGLTLDAGRVRDANDNVFERFSPGLTASYKGEGVNYRSKFEMIFESSDDNSRNSETYIGQAKLGLKTSDDWRLMSSVDFVISESDQNSIGDADYIEASIGYAYRPVDNDRLNALFKYSYLHNLPTRAQTDSADNALLPMQRSHVLSADAIYDLNHHLSIGAKYGLRIGEVSTSRDHENFVKNTAQLGILRADYHVVKNWDLFGEVRLLNLVESRQNYFGAVAGVYRHLGDNMKIGVGYNFGQFSDDLNDLILNDEGVFLNMIGKF
ncbi:MAG: TonB-dependent receptor [Nitratireductor sp.]